MTRKEVKVFLNRVRDIIQNENRILDQMQQLIDRQLSITAQITGMPRGSAPFTIDDYIVQKDELIDKLKKERAAEREAYYEILLVLDQLKGMERNIMIRYYLMMQTWEQIACTIDKSYRWTQTLHSRALEKVGEILSRSC